MLVNKEAGEIQPLQPAQAVSLRPLVEADLPAVLAIEQSAFLIPWTRASFLHELHNPHGRLLVADEQGVMRVRVRKTQVSIFEALPGEVGRLEGAGH